MQCVCEGGGRDIKNLKESSYTLGQVDFHLFSIIQFFLDGEIDMTISSYVLY